MNLLADLLSFHDRVLGTEWHFWKVIGWLANAVFFSRFLVQWYVTEKRKQVVGPGGFWGLSLTRSLLMSAYAIGYNKDLVIIFAYAFTWVPYVRNLIIHRRHARGHQTCPQCANGCQPGARFCSACGTQLPPANAMPGRDVS